MLLLLLLLLPLLLLLMDTCKDCYLQLVEMLLLLLMLLKLKLLLVDTCKFFKFLSSQVNLVKSGNFRQNITFYLNI